MEANNVNLQEIEGSRSKKKPIFCFFFYNTTPRLDKNCCNDNAV